jgi:hypothetical protein
LLGALERPFLHALERLNELEVTGLRADDCLERHSAIERRETSGVPHCERE